MSSFRDRIVALERIKASDLTPNPNNWRTHPHQQRQAVETVLNQIGIADALIAYTTKDGELMLLDGHLRQNLDPDQEYPVLITDLDEAEAMTFLATFDPLTSMAQADEHLLETLLTALHYDQDSDMQALLDSIASDFDMDLGFGDLDMDASDLNLGDATDQVVISVLVPRHRMNLDLETDFRQVAESHDLRLRISGAL